MQVFVVGGRDAIGGPRPGSSLPGMNAPRGIGPGAHGFGAGVGHSQRHLAGWRCH